MREIEVGPYCVERVWKGYYIARLAASKKIIGRLKFKRDDAEGHWTFRRESDSKGIWSGTSSLAYALESILPETGQTRDKACVVMEAIFRMECSCGG